VQACHFAGDGLAESWNVQRGEVIHLYSVRAFEAVQSVPRGFHHLLIVETEVVKDHHTFVASGRIVSELDLRQHPVGMTLRHQEWSGVVGCSLGETMCIDEADAGIDRVYSQSQPRDVEETHGSQHPNVESFVGK
jgi:hypothetical protein